MDQNKIDEFMKALDVIQSTDIAKEIKKLSAQVKHFQKTSLEWKMLAKGINPQDKKISETVDTNDMPTSGIIGENKEDSTIVSKNAARQNQFKEILESEVEKENEANKKNKTKKVSKIGKIIKRK